MDEDLNFTFGKNKADEKYGGYINFQQYIYKTTDMFVNNITSELKIIVTLSLLIFCTPNNIAPKCQNILVFFELPYNH